MPVIAHCSVSSFHPTKGEASEPTLLASPVTHHRWYALTMFQTFQGFCQRRRWTFYMSSPQVQSKCGSCLDVRFGACITVIHFFICRFSHGPQHFGLRVFSRFLAFHRLVQVHVLIKHGFPLWSVISVEHVLTEGVPVLVNKGWLPSFVSHIRGVDEGTQNTFFMSCARKVSSAPSRTTAPGYHSRNNYYILYSREDTTVTVIPY